MDKINRKSFRINGDKKERIGIPLGIHDKYGDELKSGDEILWFGSRCIILWNREYKTWDAMILDSCWYGDKKKYDPNSYGKSYQIPMDDGARMEIIKCYR